MDYLHTLIFYQPITPLHVGCGQDVGVVDLPVIRERTTGYSFIPGSGIRGSVRDLCERKHPDDGLTDLLFGPTADRDEEVRYAGCVAVHDAKVLLFPVRSDRSVFLWVTCPAVLARFARDVAAFLSSATAWEPPAGDDLGDDRFLGPQALTGNVHLEELSFAGHDGAPADVEWREKLEDWVQKVGDTAGVPALAGRTVLVSDRSFFHFVSHATTVIQHNRLTSAKTVEEGALFSVEAVPPETIFYGFFGTTTSRKPPGEGEERVPPEEVMEKLRALWATAGYLHLGGDESTGLGVTRVVWAG